MYIPPNNLRIRCFSIFLGAWIVGALQPAYADNPFEPGLLENAEIEIEKQPQEKEKELTPYVFYGYKKDKLFITTRDGNYTFVPTVTLQLRHQNEVNDGELIESTFRLRRARLQLDGTFLSPALQYEADVELRTSSDGSEPMRLQDFYMDYAWDPGIRLRAGQFKIPYSYQFILSGTRLQFNERSIANRAFSPGRDLGLMLHGRNESDTLSYATGLFNGEGQNRWDQNQRPAALAHVRWNPLGQYPTEESDFQKLSEPRVLFSAQSWWDTDETQGLMIDTSAFAGFKYQGLSLQGQLFFRENVNDSAADLLQNDAWGYYAQTGYFFLPDWEAAMRLSQVSTDFGLQHEYGAALNYYLQGHHLKFQLDYAALEDPRETNPWSHRVIGQMQLSF